MLQLESRPAGTVVRIYGELDGMTSGAFEEILQRAESARGLVVVTLEKCTYLDSSALAVLYRNERRLAERLWIAVPNATPAHRIFVAAGVAAHFQMVENVRQAFAAADVA